MRRARIDQLERAAAQAAKEGALLEKACDDATDRGGQNQAICLRRGRARSSRSYGARPTARRPRDDASGEDQEEIDERVSTAQHLLQPIRLLQNAAAERPVRQADRGGHAEVRTRRPSERDETHLTADLMREMQGYRGAGPTSAVKSAAPCRRRSRASRSRRNHGPLKEKRLAAESSKGRRRPSPREHKTA